MKRAVFSPDDLLPPDAVPPPWPGRPVRIDGTMTSAGRSRPAQITASTLVLGGLEDRVVDVRVAEQMARVIPDSRLALLDGVGHVAQMEVPRTVARAVVTLLDEAGVRADQGGHIGMKHNAQHANSHNGSGAAK